MHGGCQTNLHAVLHVLHCTNKPYQVSECPKGPSASNLIPHAVQWRIKYISHHYYLRVAVMSVWHELSVRYIELQSNGEAVSKQAKDTNQQYTYPINAGGHKNTQKNDGAMTSRVSSFHSAL